MQCVIKRVLNFKSEKMLSNPNFPEIQNFLEVLSTLCYLSHLTAYLDLFHRELNKKCSKSEYT